MNATNLEEYARQLYNATNDTFFTQTEIWKLIGAAQTVLATKAKCIRRVYETTSVASQREYSYPAYTSFIYRVAYDGKKLLPITFREDDALTIEDEDTTETGESTYYAIWNNILYLRPTPDTTGKTIRIYSYNRPHVLATSDLALDVPDEYQYDLVHYMLGMMYAKDQNINMSQYHMNLWEKAVLEAVKTEQRKNRSDGNQVVQPYEEYPRVNW
jgi:hypothetical protein